MNSETLNGAKMIEESGQVVAVEGDFIWVQTRPRSSCSACHVGSDCGTSTLARWFGQRSNRVRVRNTLNLQEGQGAVIGIHESALLKASLIAYLMPMLSMVVSAMMAAAQGAGDGVVALYSLLGLGLGLLILQRLGNGQLRRAYQATLVRQASDAKHTFTIALPPINNEEPHHDRSRPAHH
jgi:sigma-E factor negative regulatory protein RseC